MSGVLDCTSPLTDCVIGDEPDADGEQDTAERIVGEQGEQAGAEEEEQVSVVVLPKYHPVATPDEAHAMLGSWNERADAHHDALLDYTLDRYEGIEATLPPHERDDGVIECRVSDYS